MSITKQAKQDEVLKALGDDATLDILYDLWRLVRTVPSKAVEIIVQFQDVHGSCGRMVGEMRATLAAFESVRGGIPAMMKLAEDVRAAAKVVEAIDEGKFLNRVNRIMDAAERLGELKKSGALDVLMKLGG